MITKLARQISTVHFVWLYIKPTTNHHYPSLIWNSKYTNYLSKVFYFFFIYRGFWKKTAFISTYQGFVLKKKKLVFFSNNVSSDEKPVYYIQSNRMYQK